MTIKEKAFWWLRNVAVSLDQFANALLLGDPDETISSRMAKNYDKCLICRFGCRILNWIDKDHCAESLEQDEGKDALK